MLGNTDDLEFELFGRLFVIRQTGKDGLGVGFREALCCRVTRHDFDPGEDGNMERRRVIVEGVTGE